MATSGLSWEAEGGAGGSHAAGVLRLSNFAVQSALHQVGGGLQTGRPL